MAFLKNLNITAYRGINNLQIANMGNVNLIVGDNNCGKTSALEAVLLLRTSGNLASLYKVARLRDSFSFFGGSPIFENFMCMFPKTKDELRIEVNGTCNEKNISCSISGINERILIDTKDLYVFTKRNNAELTGELEADSFRGKYITTYGNDKKTEELSINSFSRISGTVNSDNDAFNIVYVSPFEHLSGNITSGILKNDRYKDICIQALRLFDEDIEDILIFRSDVGNRPIEYIKHKKLGNMPVSSYGDGIKKVLVIASAIARAAGGLLLVDEIETAIHKKYYDDIFKFAIKACKAFGVQLFITTHSMEAIDGILATQDYEGQSDSDDIKVITLKRVNTNTHSRVLSGREVFENRENFGFEVRL